MLRCQSGFGKTSSIHTTSILRLSSDLPIVIEVVDTEDKIEFLKEKLGDVITEGQITQEKVKVILYEGREKE